MPIIAIYAIIAAVIFGAGFGSGWTVKDWKDGKHIATIESANSVLSASNDQCKTDIDGVRAGVAVVVKATEDKARAAASAMQSAAELAAKHSRTAITIKAAPTVPADKQCAAIEQEQIDYVKSRRTDS